MWHNKVPTEDESLGQKSDVQLRRFTQTDLQRDTRKRFRG